VAKWREDADARVVAAEAATAVAEAKATAAAAAARDSLPIVSTSPPAAVTAPDPTYLAALLAENRELVSDAERRAIEYEALELTATELRARGEAAAAASADAPHLRAENYDLAVKHRSGLRRLHQELGTRRGLEERVEGKILNPKP